MNASLIFETLIKVPPGPKKSALQDRWKTRKLSRLRRDIIQSIMSNSKLPSDIEGLEYFYAGRLLTLIDLRGIDLSDLDVPNYDLTYCALDYANFSKSKLTGTKLQYSRIFGANFESSVFDGVQASPVDARKANFKSATVRCTFLMYSSFASANLTQAVIQSTALGGASLLDANLTDSRILEGVDLSLATLPKNISISAGGVISQTKPQPTKNATPLIEETAVQNFGFLNTHINKVLRDTLDRVVAEKYVKITDRLVLNGVIVPSKKPSVVAVQVKHGHLLKSSGKIVSKFRIYEAKTEPKMFKLGDVVEIVKITGDTTENRKQGLFKTFRRRKTVSPTKVRVVAEDWIVSKVLNKSTK